MFNVSALLLDDALLKCVVTEVVFFQLLLLKHWYFTWWCRDTLEVWWDFYWPCYYKCFPDSDSEISLKIGQYLMKHKFHLPRHVTSRHDSTRSKCRAHAFWLCRACRTARLDTLVRRARHVERVESCRDVTWRAKWNLGLSDRTKQATIPFD